MSSSDTLETIQMRASALWKAIERDLTEILVSKIAEQSLRIAGVLTVVLSRFDDMYICAKEMQAGVDLARYSLSELISIEADAHVPQEQADAEKLMAWITHHQHRYIYSSQLQRFAPSSLRKAVRYIPAINELVTDGYLMPIPEGKELDERHRKVVWQILQFILE